MPFDSDGNYYVDTNYGDYYDNTQEQIPSPNTGGQTYNEYGEPTGPYNVPQSQVTTNSDGSISVTNQDGSTSNYPAGSLKQDASGNWVDQLGKIVAPAAGLLGTALSPYLANLGTNGYLKKTADMLTNAGQGVRNVATPDLLKMIPTLQKQVQQGTMSPATYQAVLAQIQGKVDPANAQATSMQDSLLSGVNSDQESLLGARKSLDQLSNIADNKGMTEADRAAFASFMNQQNANAAQQREAQIQQLQMQGNAGTGAELAARLSGTQGAANSNAAAGATMAQSAQARALAAIQAGLSGNTALNQQMFSQDAQKAAAQDAVNQFNAQAKNAVNQTNAQLQQQANLANFNTQNQLAMQNAQAANQAGQYNAGNTQQSNLSNFNMANTIAGKNTDITNQNLLMPYTATQANFTNALDKAKNAGAIDVGAGNAMSGLLNPQINRSMNQGGAAAATTAPQSSGGDSGGTNWGQVAGAAASIIGSIWSDEDLKEDKHVLSDTDIDNMMAHMTGYKYRYKGDKTNPQVAGVMAQDAEQGMPDSVVDTPAGKMIQKPEMLSNVLAVLANQHDRIKRMEGKN